MYPTRAFDFGFKYCTVWGRGIDCKVLSSIIQTSVNFAMSVFFEWKYMKAF